MRERRLTRGAGVSAKEGGRGEGNWAVGGKAGPRPDPGVVSPFLFLLFFSGFFSKTFSK